MFTVIVTGVVDELQVPLETLAVYVVVVDGAAYTVVWYVPAT